jgi:hypothetical protein
VLAGEARRRDTERIWDRHMAPSLRSVAASPSA